MEAEILHFLLHGWKKNLVRCFETKTFKLNFAFTAEFFFVRVDQRGKNDLLFAFEQKQKFMLFASSFIFSIFLTQVHAPTHTCTHFCTHMHALIRSPSRSFARRHKKFKVLFMFHFKKGEKRRRRWRTDNRL